MELRTSTILRLRDALLQSGSRKSPVTSSAYRTLIQKGLLSDAEKEAIERIAPHAESMFLVIAADEQVTDTELIALRGAVRGLTGEALSDDIVGLMMQRYAQSLAEEGLEKRLQTIAQLLDTTEAANAFALAAAVALADGQIVAEENSVMSQMRRAYGVSQERAQSILGDLSGDL